MNEEITIGQYIKELREKKDFSQRQLYLYSGVSNAEISKIEKGIRKKVPPETLKKLAPHLGVSYEELMRVAGYLKPDIVVQHGDSLHVAEVEGTYKTDIHIPNDYPYPITVRDRKQYDEQVVNKVRSFFMDDKVAEEDKEKMFKTISDFFWEAKIKNKKKYGRKKKKQEDGADGN